MQDTEDPSFLRREVEQCQKLLTLWSEQEGIPRTSLDRVYEGLSEAGKHQDQLRYGTYLFPGLDMDPWPTVELPFLDEVSGAFYEIGDEYRACLAGGTIGRHPEALQLASRGPWSTYKIFYMGALVANRADACPRTVEALRRIPDIDFAGTANFSRLSPGTCVKPHCGFMNGRLRCHLGLDIPPGSSIRVGGEWRNWREGDWLVFDDSCEHEVSIPSGERYRAVLLLDVWHPGLSAVERRALRLLLKIWRHRVLD